MTDYDLSSFDGKLIDGLMFCKQAYEFLEQIRAEQNGISKLRLLDSNREKKLLEEILPICKFIQCKYRAGRYIEVCWQNGNQQYDAEIRQRGGSVDMGEFPEHAFLEVTCARHPNEHLKLELLDKQGYCFGVEGILAPSQTIKKQKAREIESTPVVYKRRDFIERFSLILIDRIHSKVGKTYPKDTSLIVQCTLNRLYTPDEWGCLKRLMIEARIDHDFREIYVFDQFHEYDFSLWPSSADRATE